MCSERKVSEWLRVKDSKLWELPQEKGTDILPALRLSYNHLPSHLKLCFAFCSIYPKDYVMNKEELVLLWMANGFLQPDGKMELEDYGDSVFNNMLHRSFFQDLEKNEYGIIKTCKLHDLMHDLACSVSENECIVVEDSCKTLQKGIRHCSVVSNSSEAAKLVDLESLSKFNPVLCTELLLGYYNEHIEVTFRNLGRIRALDLSKTRTEMVPVSIGKMKQLRYLNLSTTIIKSLPESICNLRNLQSLKLAYCSSLLKLPERTSKMSGLRHLDVKGCSKLTEMPIGMGQLSQLQTLNFFVVSSENGRGIKELQGLNYLRGSIDIEGLEHIRDSEEVREPILLRKPNISRVRLCWSTKEGVDGELQQKVLEHGLQPEQSLKALFIEGYRGVILPTWMVLLQKLVKISLKDCNSCLCLPPLGQLPLLKVLIIMNMHSVKSISDEFYGGNLVQGFPALEVLQLDQMPSLEEWSPPSLVENPRQLFACLKELKIFGCPLLKSFPFLPCVQTVQLTGCIETILRSLENLTGLRTLKIIFFEGMTSVPDRMLINSSSLQYLLIYACDKLKSLAGNIETLTSLTSLTVKSCGELVCLSELEGLLQKLNSLKELKIWGCWSMKCLPVMGVQGFSNSLMDLSIFSCSSLTSLSEGLQHLTSLKNLSVKDCPNLEFKMDDFQHLISLQTLAVGQLSQLTALPEGIQYLTTLEYLDIWECMNVKMLPQWLQQLTALQSLSIWNCNPDLHRRCEKDVGEDWHIISHIQELDIPKCSESSSSPSSLPLPEDSSTGCYTGLFNKLRTCIINN